MKILVTGANGYIGLHIVKTLLDKGIQGWIQVINATPMFSFNF